MPELDQTDQRTAYMLLRAVAGMNMLMHGVSRWLVGPAVFAGKLVEQFANTPLPLWSLRAFGFTLPAVEGLLGLLLLIGLQTRAALVGASLLILLLTFGSSLAQDWNAAAIQLVYAVVFSALLALRRYNCWSLDACVQKPSA